jgi:hypothetical protein
LCRIQSVVGVVQSGINNNKQTPDFVQRSFIGWSRSDVGLGFPTGSERCVLSGTALGVPLNNGETLT